MSVPSCLTSWVYGRRAWRPSGGEGNPHFTFCFIGAVFMVFSCFTCGLHGPRDLRVLLWTCVHGLVTGRRSGRTCQTAPGVTLPVTPGSLRGLPILVFGWCGGGRWFVQSCSGDDGAGLPGDRHRGPLCSRSRSSRWSTGLCVVHATGELVKPCIFRRSASFMLRSRLAPVVVALRFVAACSMLLPRSVACGRVAGFRLLFGLVGLCCWCGALVLSPAGCALVGPVFRFPPCWLSLFGLAWLCRGAALRFVGVVASRPSAFGWLSGRGPGPAFPCVG